MANSEKNDSIIKSIQTTLSQLSLYRGRIDGLFGNNCRDALVKMLKKVKPDLVVGAFPGNTFDAASVFTFIQTVLAKAGFYSIAIDGKWGPTSQTGFDKFVAAYRAMGANVVGSSTLPLQWATVMNKHVTEDQLKAMLPQINWPVIPRYIGPLNETMDIFGITTPLRKAHFMAQMLHETQFFKYNEEIASGKAYEGRLDLGNTQPGDGVLFKGRGWFQLTGRDNYVKCQAYLRERLNDPSIDITSTISAASQVASIPLYSALTAGYFWGVIKPKLNEAADRDDIYWVSVYVNGWAKQPNPYYPDKEKEPNHMKERVEMLGVAKKAFGLI